MLCPGYLKYNPCVSDCQYCRTPHPFQSCRPIFVKFAQSNRYNFRRFPALHISTAASNFSLSSCWMVALARKRPSLLLEEKVSPVGTLVTDVVENATNSPAVSGYRTFYRTPHQSQIGFEEPICASFSSRRSLCLCGATA